MKQMRTRRVIAALVLGSLLLQLAGCATVAKGDTQTVALRVQTADGQLLGGVPCELSNKLGRWSVSAPGSVVVKRSVEPLIIKCESEQWVMAEQLKAESEASLGSSAAKGAGTGAGVGAALGLLSPIVFPFIGPMVLFSVVAGATAGAVYGGVSGAVVDAASGAAFDYAPEIAVIVKPRVVEPVVAAR